MDDLPAADLREVLIAGYRWRLPLRLGSIDDQNLRAWAARSAEVNVFVRGTGYWPRSQIINARITVRTSPLSPVPFFGVFVFAIWAIWHYLTLPKSPLIRVQSPDPLGGLVASLAIRFRRPQAFVVQVLGPFFDMPSSFGWKGAAIGRIQLHAARRADVVRCASSDSVQAGLRRGLPADKLKMAWSVSPLDAFLATEPPACFAGKVRVLHAGSVVHRKGLDIVVNAISQLPAASRPALTIAGSGPSLPGLIELARKRAVTVVQLGHINHSDLPPVMAEHPIFILASRADASPRAVMEAMAAGCAVITTDVGDLRSMVGDAGIVVPPDDVGALAGALKALCADSELRTRLGQEARTRAAQAFSFDAAFDRVWEIGLPVEPKLLFVLPDLDYAGDGHYFHTLALMHELQRTVRRDVSCLVLRPAIEPVLTKVVAVSYLKRAPLFRIGGFLTVLFRLNKRDVIFVRISVPALALSLFVARLRGFRVAFWHATWLESFEKRRRGLTSRVLKFLLPRVHTFITFPEYVGEYYVQALGARRDRLALVPNNVDVGHMTPRPWPGGPGVRLLFVGRLSPRKGAQDLPRLAHFLHCEMEAPWSLVIAGDGPLRPVIRSITFEEVTSIGSTPNGQAMDLMRQADIILMPSYAEACSRVLLEGCRLATPVVCYDIPPLRSLVGNAVAELLFVPCGDPEALARKATQLLGASLSERNEVTAILRDLSASFSTEAVAPRLAAALRA